MSKAQTATRIMSKIQCIGAAKDTEPGAPSPYLPQMRPPLSYGPMSRRLIVTILLCGALYLVGNGRVSLWDRDEPRYAQASRQMLASGDWVVPKLLDEPRIKKPPLIYWCQAASMAAFTSIAPEDRKSTRLNSSHTVISYAVFCLKKKKNT